MRATFTSLPRYMSETSRISISSQPLLLPGIKAMMALLLNFSRPCNRLAQLLFFLLSFSLGCGIILILSEKYFSYYVPKGSEGFVNDGYTTRIERLKALSATILFSRNKLAPSIVSLISTSLPMLLSTRLRLSIHLCLLSWIRGIQSLPSYCSARNQQGERV